MKNRSRTEIVAAILEAANGGATKTKIMYKALLSYAQLKEHLSVLLHNGLLEHNMEEKKYKTTGKGMKFLGVYSQMETLTPRVSAAEISVR